MTKQTAGMGALHLSVMLFGLSAVLGKLVEAPAAVIAGGRVLCSFALLAALSAAFHTLRRLKTGSDYAVAGLAGAMMAVHWTTFFYSAQLSSVAVATITFSAFPLFVTFLEPALFRERLRAGDVAGAVVLLAGVGVMVPEFSLGNSQTSGVFWGMVSALAYAAMALCNRRLSARYPATTVCLYEQGAAVLLLLPVLLKAQVSWTPQTLAGIAAIGFVCTAFAHTLFVAAQKYVTAQTAGMVSGMEAVYSMIYAFFFLGEVPSVRELAGGALVLCMALVFSMRQRKAPQKVSQMEKGRD